MYTFSQLLTFSAIGAALLLSPSAVAQVGLGLSPLRLELTATPGLSRTDSLSISNESATPMHIRANTLDFWIDDDQQPQFSASGPGSNEHSCRNWLRLNPVEFDLAPNEHRLVRYSMRYPDQLAEGSFHCAASFTTSPQPSETPMGMSTNVRLITTFYATQGHPRPAARVLNVRFAPPTDPTKASRQAIVQVENTSSTYFRVIGNLEVRNQADALIESVPFQAIPVLPNRVQPFTIALTSAYEPGQTIRARVDIGDGEIQEIHVRQAPAQPVLQ